MSSQMELDQTTQPASATTKSKIRADAPRVATSYILFSKDERENIKREHPDATSTEIFKRLGERWRTADAETKAKYEGIYQANKAKYDTLHSAGAEPVPSSAPTKKLKTVKPDAPARASTAFILFSQAMRASIKEEFPNATNTEIFQKLGEKWRSTDADTKAKYEAIYQANKAALASAAGTATTPSTSAPSTSAPTTSAPSAPVSASTPAPPASSTPATSEISALVSATAAKPLRKKGTKSQPGATEIHVM